MVTPSALLTGRDRRRTQADHPRSIFCSPWTMSTGTQRRPCRRHLHPSCRVADGKTQRSKRNAGRFAGHKPPNHLTGTDRAPDSSCQEQHSHGRLIHSRQHNTRKRTNLTTGKTVLLSLPGLPRYPGGFCFAAGSLLN